MSVQIFKDKKTSEFAVQTTCLTADLYVMELAEALNGALRHENDGALAAYGILRNAMPIAFKLSGYKAEEVSEQRTLLCGTVSPSESDMVSSAGNT
jgi:hypothetical protein